MLTRKATLEMVKEWKETAAQYRPLLRPGRKTGREILAYLTGKYPVRELPAESISETVADNLLLNEVNARKLPAGALPEAVGFMVEGSSLLWDELFAFRGLDEEDLGNYYMVAEYVACLRRFDLLDSVLAGKTP